ncbi:helix-turn-helix transcriptional regulator [Rhizobium rhododendri]|uniref:AraC family transcriptional regulator n=1 Tax=Rhizobium rhododendri TaxID=2506430 RepID=A0ABY8IRL5_9HYPH|nr:AraC family transcriptional regulator [Rhizobium rhododendri]WFS25961.1 AraC family transcriptional regulator [Rhizobium rhododendri]
MQNLSSFVFDFSTIDFPERDRFQMWIQDNHCDCRLWDTSSRAYDARATGAALGPLILSGRQWLGEGLAPAYEIFRTDRRIRTDGYDFFRFTLVLGGRFTYRSKDPTSVMLAGDLFVVDASQVNECLVETNNVISIAVPRDMLPSQTALLHGHALKGGIASLLADHFISLFGNLAGLREQDIPYLVQSTLQLLTAAVSSASDEMQVAATPIRDLLFRRILRYLDARLLDADLTPAKICREVGVSRAKLYQLFEGNGGIMRQIQRKRLHRAHQLLADPSQPKPHIAEIASSHGFTSEKYFYRLFKAEFGHTPGETLEKTGLHYSASVTVPIGPFGEQIIRPSGWTLPFGVPKS